MTHVASRMNDQIVLREASADRQAFRAVGAVCNSNACSCHTFQVQNVVWNAGAVISETARLPHVLEAPAKSTPQIAPAQEGVVGPQESPPTTQVQID
jgi:hypothetical protein